MDTATLRAVVQQVIQHYAHLKPSHGQIRLDAVLDETRDRGVPSDQIVLAFLPEAPLAVAV